MNDIIVNKTQSLHRCIERAREEYDLAQGNFRTDYSRQDAAILNIVRACELAIDIANYVIKSHKMGIPTSSAESFQLLARKKVISHTLEQKMENMVGFRNLTVHQYEKINIAIVEAVIAHGLNDLVAFSEVVMEFLGM